MNKNLKKIISIILTVSAFSVIAPATDLNLMTTKVYAATDTGVTSLKIKTSGGTTLRTYDSNDYESKNQVNDDALEVGKIYYAKTSSSNIKVSTSGVSEDNIRVFKGTSSSTKGARTGSSISLPSSDTTTIIVRVYSENPGAAKYSNKTNMIGEYRIKVKCTRSSNDDEDNDDKVYLKSISLSSETISFSKKTSNYDINVEENIDEVTIAAKPDCDSDEYDNYKVRIDGTKVDEDDKFKEKVSLNKGKNEIKITVEDDDNTRTYTLNIARGKISSTNTSTTTNNTTSNTEDNVIAIKSSQWVKTNGLWQYNDATGKTLKNSWIQNYYVQADGNMVTGWANISGNWYYFGSDGAKKTGWQSVGGSWYYLDSQGIMQTGWIKDLDGKYYYLNSNGSMAYNTNIGGYKLGVNGAWVK